MNECPKCRCRDFSKGVQVGHANLRPENLSMFNGGSELIMYFV
jgi:hypothetical protein